ncbi:MAG: DUF4440 domain-containing protein [Acidobacteria bacterium]|nr:MAG: DUF4440 domain-containing protein [Acidobacteriota bacterium]
MRKFLGITLLFICIPAVLPGLGGTEQVPADQQTAIESAIQDQHTRLKTAAEQLDADVLFKYVLSSAKGVIIEDGQVRWTRDEALASTRQGLKGLKQLSYVYGRKELTVISPDVVLWVGQGTASATLQDGREISAPFAETIVFARKEGQWQVLHAHRSAPGR